MKNIPKFRYLEDAVRYVGSIDKELDEYGQLISKQHALLAYLYKPKSWVTESLNRVTAALTISSSVEGSDDYTAFDSKLDKIVPSIRQLQKQYGLVEDMYRKYRSLESIEIQINMAFADGRDLQKALGEIYRVKNKVVEQMRKILTYLNDVAKAHVPSNFQNYMEVIRGEVEEHVLFKDSSLFLYVNVTDTGNLAFTYYLMLEDVVNQEGEVSPHLYIAVQLVLDINGREEPCVNVYLDYDFELPNQLLNDGMGMSVDSAQSAIQALSTMLETESFKSSLGVLPLTVNKNSEFLASDLFNYRDYINKVAVDGSTMIFILKKLEASKDVVKTIAYKLSQEVKELIRRSKNTRLAMDIEKVEDTYSIVFRIIGNSEGEFSTYDAEFLKYRFGLTDTQLRRVVNILNAG